MQLTQEKIQYLLDESMEQLTEEMVQLLTENRIEFIKNAVKDKISTAHDPESANLSSDKIVDTIAKKIDPTTRKSHTEWLVNRYKAGDFKLGEAKDVKKTLGKYEESVPHITNKDIKSFKSLNDLKDQIAPASMRVAHNAVKEAPEAGESGEPQIYSSEGVAGFELKSKAASIRNYGPNGKVAKTTWCTAANGSNNMFNGYRGGKYTMRFPNGRVLQMHHSSGQMQNEANRAVDVDTDPAYSPYKQQIAEFAKQTAHAENATDSPIVNKLVPTSHEEIQGLIDAHDAASTTLKEKAANKEYTYDAERAVKNARQNLNEKMSRAEVTDDQIEKLKNFTSHDDWSDKEKSYDLTSNLSSSKFLKPHQVDSLMDHHTSKSDYTAAVSALAENPNASDEAIHKAIGWAQRNNHHSSIESMLMNSPNMKEEHFNRINPLLGTKSIIIDKSPSAHIPHSYFEDVKTVDALSVASHKNVPQHILDEFSTQKSPKLLSAVISNPSASKKNISDVIETGKDIKIGVPDMTSLIERPDLEPEERSKIVKHFAAGGFESTSGPSWLSSNRLTRDDLHNVINSPAIHESLSSHSNSILSNPKIRHKELDDIINGPAFKPHHASRILTNPHARSSNVDSMLAKHNGSELHDIILDSNSNIITPSHISAILNHPTARMEHKIRAFEHPANSFSHFAEMKSNPRFHSAISVSKNAPPSILHELALSPHAHIRENVASNPNTEKKTLEILKTDAEPSIATTAAKRIK